MSNSAPAEQTFAVATTLAFVLLSTWTALHHEMWRDEIQAWLIARDSATVAELLRNLKYDGHPGLWHLLLMPLTRLTWSPHAMQALHLIIATTSVWLVVRHAPFPRGIRALFAFGYFPVYEYAVISRNYAPGLLLLLLICLLWPARQKRLMLLSGLMVLLGHTSVHGLILAIALASGIALEGFGAARARHAVALPRHFGPGIAVMALGFLSAALQMYPPGDSGFATGWFRTPDLARADMVLDTVAASFLPLPDNAVAYWNSHFLASQFRWATTYQKLQWAVSIMCLLCATLSLRRHPIALAVYSCATTGLLLFFYIKYPGYLRHHGFLFLAFFAACWLARADRDHSERDGNMNMSFLALILVVQAAAGLRAAYLEYQHPFSNAASAARLLAQHGMANLPLVAEPDDRAMAVIGQIPATEAYYVRAQRWGSFVRWDRSRLSPADDATILAMLEQLHHERRARIALVLNRPLSPQILARDNRISMIAKADRNAAVADERYFLYVYGGVQP